MAVHTLPSDDELMSEINKHFRNYLSNPENIDSSANALMEDLIDDAIMSVIFEVEVERKMGIQKIILGEPDDDEYKIIDAPDVDIFGQGPGKKNYECVCPNCNRTLAASRFAPHLEKCMGMGRNSSRLASRRIATNASKDAFATTSTLSGDDDDDDDADWTLGVDKKGKKKKDRVPEKKKFSKNIKLYKNGSGSNSSAEGGPGDVPNISFESLSESDKKVFLTQIYGVVLEHNKKVCTRSLKGAEEQKKINKDHEETDLKIESENLQVDVDTYEEGDSQSVRECLGRSWELENSNTSSPADSVCTSASSSSSKKKDKSSSGSSKCKGKASSSSSKCSKPSPSPLDD